MRWRPSSLWGLQGLDSIIFNDPFLPYERSPLNVVVTAFLSFGHVPSIVSFNFINCLNYLYILNEGKIDLLMYVCTELLWCRMSDMYNLTHIFTCTVQIHFSLCIQTEYVPALCMEQSWRCTFNVRFSFTITIRYKKQFQFRFNCTQSSLGGVIRRLSTVGAGIDHIWAKDLEMSLSHWMEWRASFPVSTLFRSCNERFGFFIIFRIYVLQNSNNLLSKSRCIAVFWRCLKRSWLENKHLRHFNLLCFHHYLLWGIWSKIAGHFETGCLRPYFFHVLDRLSTNSSHGSIDTFHPFFWQNLQKRNLFCFLFYTVFWEKMWVFKCLGNSRYF